MKRNKFGINLTRNVDKKYNYILIFIGFSLVYQLIRYNFNVTKAITGVLTTFIFATFISYIYSNYVNLYKPTTFFYWWWRIYGIMLFMGIIARIVFGEF